MEVNDKDRIIISKPVPSRPNFTGIRLELLAGSINVSPPPTNMRSETPVAAIKPKTVRVKPTISQAQLDKDVQADASEAAPNGKSNYTQVDNQSTIFKPLAKVVSRATISLLANLRNSNITNQQAPSQVNASARPDKLLHYSNRNSSLLSQTELSESVEPRKKAQPVLGGEPIMAASSTTVADRRSCDGYNWRKYGQKQVKGSDYPRSYYKCTHPKCAMKKKVERSLDGQIKEIVYKGEHNHPKLDYSMRNVSEIQVQQLANAGTDQEYNRGELKFHENIGVENEGFERQMGSEDLVKISNSWLFGNYAPLYYHPVDIEEHKAGDRTAVDPAGCGRGCEEAAMELKVDDNVTKKKRRKRDNQKNEAGKSGKTVRDPRILVHNNSETEIIRDGFRWRKYGQKVVRGNPYPRSYYRCNVPKCNVRKHVERALDDPGTFITTYEGRHNHEMPMKILSNSTAELEALIP